MIVFKILICIVCGYVMGMFTTGVFVARYIGKTDIRQHGSGNVGTTNVLRTLGWLPSLLTLLGDTLKGVLAAWIGYLLLGDAGARLMGFFAVVGHIWPVISHFKGGKGIAASFGVLLFVDPLIMLVILAIQLVVIAVTKYMGLASIISCGLYVLSAFIFHRGEWTAIVFAIALAAVVIFAHRDNIRRLLNGKENKLEFSKIKRFNKAQ